jgi:hypothetical protein
VDFIEEIEMGIKQVLMTPQMADEFLKMNTANFRKPDQSRVVRYANDMSCGKWQFNGDTIKVSNGQLLDGQHRLLAVKVSGCSVEMLVVDGIDASAGLTIDDGKPRSAAQWLRHIGVKNANSMAAAARWGIIYEKGLWKNTSAGCSYSRSEIIAFAEKNHDALQSSVRMAFTSKGLCAGSYLAALLLFAAGKHDPRHNRTVEWFAKALASGLNVNADDPVYHLRQRLSVSHSSKRVTPFLERMLLTVAWNKTARGESCRTLKYAATGPTKNTPINTIEVAPFNEDL